MDKGAFITHQKKSWSMLVKKRYWKLVSSLQKCIVVLHPNSFKNLCSEINYSKQENGAEEYCIAHVILVCFNTNLTDQIGHMDL